jgi:hypothetical protein
MAGFILEMNMWKTIDSAPRDGTQFIAYDPDKNQYRVVVYCDANGRGGVWGDFIWGEPDECIGVWAERCFTLWTEIPPLDTPP